jgi:hypothetical protein
MSSRCSSGGGSSCGRTGRRACASCSGACRSCPYPSPASHSSSSSEALAGGEAATGKGGIGGGGGGGGGAYLPFLRCSARVGGGGAPCWEMGWAFCQNINGPRGSVCGPQTDLCVCAVKASSLLKGTQKQKKKKTAAGVHTSALLSACLGPQQQPPPAAREKRVQGSARDEPTQAISRCCRVPRSASFAGEGEADPDVAGAGVGSEGAGAGAGVPRGQRGTRCWWCAPASTPTSIGSACPPRRLRVTSPFLRRCSLFRGFSFFFVRARAESRIRLPLDSRECDANRTLSFVENLMPKC